MIFFTQSRARDNGGFVFRIGLDPGKLDNIVIRKQFLDLVVKSHFLDRTAAVCKEYVFAVPPDHAGKVFDGVFTEIERRGCVVSEVSDHCNISFSFSCYYLL